MPDADDVLEDLAEYAPDFVEWLNAEEPLVRAYTACILANIAFLEPGQKKVLEADGVAPLMRLLKTKKEDTKVTLHSTAAIQNLTYKNTACCSEVLEHQGEKVLKNLLSHKKEDVQQFAAGALANLQLYKRKDVAGGGEEGHGLPKSSMSRKVAKILNDIRVRVLCEPARPLSHFAAAALAAAALAAGALGAVIAVRPESSGPPRCLVD